MAKPLDWTKTGTIVAMADWLRRESGAFAVIVMRRDDGALSADEEIAPRDVKLLIEEHLPPMIEDLAAARVEQRKKGARVQWGDLHE